MKLNTVWKWWDYRRVGLCKKLAAEGVVIRPLPYDDLSESEQQTVYDCWFTCQVGRESLLKETEQ